jgi:DNA-binding transcriptional MerR regulator
MSSRSYLSIGDVLTLLRQEFPDVTISKIRFLESQGLVNPERTPSGYRKFYDHDVERLRWVLRQQREHFLPLKVIKDRLDDPGGAEVADEGVAEAGAERAASDDAADVADDAADVAAASAAAAIPEPAESVARRAAVDGAAAEAAVAGAMAGSGHGVEVGHRVEEPALVGQRATAEPGVAAVDSAAAGGAARTRSGDGPMLPGIETSPTSGADRAGPVPASGSTLSSPNASSAGTVSVSAS